MRRPAPQPPESDGILSARLSAALMRLSPKAAEDEAVEVLRRIAGPRTDLLARCAGLIRGGRRTDQADSPWWDRAVELAVKAGADPADIQQWTEEGRRREAVRWQAP